MIYLFSPKICIIYWQYQRNVENDISPPEYRYHYYDLKSYSLLSASPNKLCLPTVVYVPQSHDIPPICILSFFIFIPVSDDVKKHIVLEAQSLHYFDLSWIMGITLLSSISRFT